MFVVFSKEDKGCTKTVCPLFPAEAFLRTLLWMAEPSLLGSQDGGRFICFALESECTRVSNDQCLMTWHHIGLFEAVVVGDCECERDARNCQVVWKSQLPLISCRADRVDDHYLCEPWSDNERIAKATRVCLADVCLRNWLLCVRSFGGSARLVERWREGSIWTSSGPP